MSRRGFDRPLGLHGGGGGDGSESDAGPPGGGTAYGSGVVPSLPEPDDLHSLVIRTDFSDEAAWHRALADAARESPEGYAANLTPVDDPAFAGLDPAGCPAVPMPEHIGEVFLADARSMADGSLVVVALGEFVDEPGQSFRVVPEELWGVQNNLSIANMGFEEFAEAADATGVFRGFE